MKKIFLFLVLSFTFSCNSDDNSNPDNDSSILGKWNLMFQGKYDENGNFINLEYLYQTDCGILAEYEFTDNLIYSQVLTTDCSGVLESKTFSYILESNTLIMTELGEDTPRWTEIKELTNSKLIIEYAQSEDANFALVKIFERP